MVENCTASSKFQKDCCVICLLSFEGKNDRYVFQGVHMLMDASPMGTWPEGKERNSRIVFIGRNLESMGLDEGFEGCKLN